MFCILEWWPLKKKTCTKASLEFDSREVPGYPKLTLYSLKCVARPPPWIPRGIVVLCFCQMYALLERINAERKFWSSIPCLNQTCCFSFCLDASNSIVNMTSTFNGSKTTIYKVMATYQIVSLFWYLSAHVGLCRDVAASQFFSGWSLSLDHKLWSFDVIFKATYTAPMEAEFRVVFLLAFNWKFDNDLMTLMFRNVLKGVSTFFTTRRHVNLDAPQSLWALPKDQWLNAHIYIYTGIVSNLSKFQTSHIPKAQGICIPPVIPQQLVCVCHGFAKHRAGECVDTRAHWILESKEGTWQGFSWDVQDLRQTCAK